MKKHDYDQGYQDGFRDGIEATKARFGVASHKPAQQLGKLGGQKTASLYGKEHYKKIAKGWPKGKKRKVSVVND